MKSELVTIISTSPKRHLSNAWEKILAVFNDDLIQLQVTKRELERSHSNFGVGSLITVNESEIYEVTNISFNEKRPKYANCIVKEVKSNESI